MLELTTERKYQAKILVVDDEKDVCKVIRDMLLGDGHEVEMANSGYEALEKLEKDHFEMMVADVVMPGMDGIELLRTVKQTFPDTVVILITGYGRLETVVDAVQGGAGSFLLKPFKAKDITSAVQQALANKRLEEENHKLRSLASVVEMGRKMSSTLKLEPLAHLVVQAALKDTKSARASLMLLDPENQTLSIKAAIGLPPEIVASAREKLGQGIAGRVAETGQPLIISRGQELEPWLKEALRNPRAVSSVSMPLSVEGKVLGVLNLTNEEDHYTPSDIDLVSILSHQAAVAIRNAQLLEALQNHFLGTTVALALAIEAKDPYTRGHSEQVADYSVAIAEELGLDREAIQKIRWAGLLHDIGKIGVPDAILQKPAGLTPDESQELQRHSIVGAMIVEAVPLLRDIAPIITHHHEHYDGTGYGAGLKGKEIPLLARIVAIADAFQAMTSHRPHRPPLPPAEAIQGLREGAGTQFDPTLVAVFLKILEARRLREEKP